VSHSPKQEKRRRRSKKASSTQLNLTSMIDVIFLLLIYFVITATFTPDEGVITTKLPAQDGMSSIQLPKPPKRPLNIVVSTAGQYGYRVHIEGIPQSPADFTHLRRILSELQYAPKRSRSGPYPDDTPVMIKPDGTARWQHVVNAFNAAIGAQYSNVSFARVEQ
jgi:biopolymer transport protein ExbD